jgi:[acyl-carrier-protein] S-malonyltransferase
MTSSIAFLFPGQGSQSVGMLDAFRTHASTAGLYQQLADQANIALEEDLAALIAEGPAEQLNLTINTQPAMVLADILPYQAWLAAGGAKPHCVAGHSLGEYAALVAAQCLGLSDALRIVRVRAQAMQAAVPVGQGAMAAILGLADGDVLAACKTASVGAEVAEAVNFNAPNQVVIAGTVAGVQAACLAAKAAGAKRAVELPVSAPFHSSLMKPAAEPLAVALAGITLAEPVFPVINNVDVAAPKGTQAICDALVRQAYSPVRWVETLVAMQAMGVTLFIECGPGKVLAGLAKRVVDVPVINVHDPESLAAALVFADELQAK